MLERFLELIQISTGSRVRFSSAPSVDEWHALFEMSLKQSLVGLCKSALDRLPPSQWPPHDLVLRWSAVSRRIEIRNHDVDIASVRVSEWFLRHGFKSCILKGQGNALLYPRPGMRTPGDIDIWLCGGVRRVVDFARQHGITGKACYHHIDWEPYNDVAVEVHYRPIFMLNPIHNRRLQEWFRRRSDIQFSNTVSLSGVDGMISVPTFSFNVVYQLVHLANHFFQEGIGLRQFADYYYLLERNIETINSRDFRRTVASELRYLGLYDFARATMWVLGRVFLCGRSTMIVPPDSGRGMFLFDEIIAGGNFGKYDSRVLSGVQGGFLRHNAARLYRDVRFFRLFPSECLFEPFFRIGHFLWRRKNGYV